MSSTEDLYELAGELAPLAVLVELRALGVTTDAERVDAWRRVFERANEATTEERPFWDDYTERVERGFAVVVG